MSPEEQARKKALLAWGHAKRHLKEVAKDFGIIMVLALGGWAIIYAAFEAWERFP